MSDHFDSVKAILQIEAAAISASIENIEVEAVSKAIELLINSTGKVIVLGVGKSAIVGAKIAATLTSTGTAAIALHAADALHGDLGLVTDKDVAITLSYSGETEEIINVLPHLKLRKLPIISIVGNTSSTLARKSDIVLDASIDREACPLNLAPTASTSVAQAIGDAIAMTLMKEKGLTSDDFALNHPAGRLGKRLTLTVNDLMHSGDDNPTVAPKTPWLDMIAAIGSGAMGAVNVVSDGGELLGIITDGDLRREIGKTGSPETRNAEEVMTSKPIIVEPATLAYDALKLMEDRDSQISVLPVVEGSRCVGIIRLHDIIRSGL